MRVSSAAPSIIFQVSGRENGWLLFDLSKVILTGAVDDFM